MIYIIPAVRQIDLRSAGGAAGMALVHMAGLGGDRIASPLWF